jgi:hypothetical protein
MALLLYVRALDDAEKCRTGYLLLLDDNIIIVRPQSFSHDAVTNRFVNVWHDIRPCEHLARHLVAPPRCETIMDRLAETPPHRVYPTKSSPFIVESARRTTAVVLLPIDWCTSRRAKKNAYITSCRGRNKKVQFAIMSFRLWPSFSSRRRGGPSRVHRSPMLFTFISCGADSSSSSTTPADPGRIYLHSSSGSIRR